MGDRRPQVAEHSLRLRDRDLRPAGRAPRPWGSVPSTFRPGDLEDVRNPVDFNPEFSQTCPCRARVGSTSPARSRRSARVMDRCCAMAEKYALLLREARDVEVMYQELNQVVVRFSNPAGEVDDDHTRDVVQKVQRHGTCYPTPTLWRGWQRCGSRCATGAPTRKMSSVRCTRFWRRTPAHECSAPRTSRNATSHQPARQRRRRRLESSFLGGRDRHRSGDLALSGARSTN